MVAAPQPAPNLNEQEMATVLGWVELEEDQHEMGLQPEQQQQQKLEEIPMRMAEPQTSRRPPPPPPPPHLWVPDACKTPWTQQDDKKLLEVCAPSPGVASGSAALTGAGPQ